MAEEEGGTLGKGREGLGGGEAAFMESRRRRAAARLVPVAFSFSGLLSLLLESCVGQREQ